MAKQLSDNRLKCSFCGKSQDQVKKLIAGPGVYICDECVGLCCEIIDDELFKSATSVSAQRQYEKQAARSEAQRKRAEREEPFPSSRVLDLAAGPVKGPPGPEHPCKQITESTIDSTIAQMESYVGAYEAAGKLEDAEPFCRVLLALKEFRLGKSSVELLPVLDKLSKTYADGAARESYAQTLQWIISIKEANKDADVTEYFILLAQALIELNDISLAQRALDEASAILNKHNGKQR